MVTLDTIERNAGEAEVYDLEDSLVEAALRARKEASRVRPTR